jgi:hypothetical protein
MLREIEESAPMRLLVASLCTYEVVAIVTGCVPTITALHRRRPEIGPALTAALVWHFR